MPASAVARRARGGQLALEVFEAARDRIALGRRRREQPIADGAPLLVLRGLRLQLRLARVQVLQLALEAGDALLGWQVRTEERVAQNRGEKDAGDDEKPRQ